MDNAVTARDTGFGREPLAAFAAGLVKKVAVHGSLAFQMDLPVAPR